MRYPIVAALATIVAACHSPGEAPAPPDPGVADPVRRVAAILDYIAADYPSTVLDGEIVEQFEYDEQLLFLAEANHVAAELPPGNDPALDLHADLARLRELIVAAVPGDRVATAARATRKRTLAAYGVVLAPEVPPSFDRARQLYGENCTPCHGLTGAGDGHRARELKPRPRSFHDPAVMRELTPARAFSALTDGIEGTTMASYGLFSPSDRWSLAFYVFTLRHDAAAVARGGRVYRRARPAVAATTAHLAGASDGELLAALDQAGDDALDALAFLRGDVAFRTVGAPLDAARRHLASALAAYRNGNFDGARRELNSAYLGGFEPHEGALHTKAPEVVSKVENAFLALRDAVEAEEDVEDIEQRARHVSVLFDLAEDHLVGGGDRLAFASVFVIILREGLEGALLVLLLLGWAGQSGDGERERRAVHTGWIAAVGLGILTWIAADSLIRSVGGANRELIEGIIALLAAVVLLAASHFVLARAEVRRRVAALREKLAAAGSLARRRWLLGSLAFIVVYREAFEVVLFLNALLLAGSTTATAVVAGTASAALLLVGIVAVMARLGHKLAPAALLTTAGILLCMLAFVLSGKGVRALQEAAVIGIDPLAMPRIDWLGIFPTQQTLAAQLIAVASFILIAVLGIRQKRRGAQSTA